MMQTSNKYLNLQPVLAGAAKASGMEVLFWEDDQVTPQAREEGKDASSWAIFGVEPVSAELLRDGQWKREEIYSLQWGDDYSSLYHALAGGF